MDFNKKWLWLAVLIMALAVFLRFWNLGYFDLLSDDAINSFRALGWFDFLGGDQSAPVEWFGEIPWWARLSFHDAPPLAFACQHLFFRLFGPGVLAARLPFVLAGLGVTVLLFLTVREIKGKVFGLAAGLLAAISSYAVWISRSGLLEGVAIFFSALSLFFFIRYLVRKQNKYLYFWAAAVGLALLSKYTAIFLPAAAGLYLIFSQRKIFLKKNIWLAGLLLILILTPVIIYNFQVFQTRGHFDAALSSMVGMRPDDFKGIAQRGANRDFLANFFQIGKNFFDTASLPVAIVSLFSLIWLVLRGFFRPATEAEKFFAWTAGMAILMFLFLGAQPRFFAVALPIALIAVILAVAEILNLPAG